jgi:hypothetical protein
MKKRQSRKEEARIVPEEDLTWVKASSGYMVSAGLQPPEDPPPSDPDNPGGST